MRCPACGNRHYDPDFARCANCRFLPVTSRTLHDSTRVIVLPPSDSPKGRELHRAATTARHAKRIQLASPSVRITGDPNANVPRQTTIHRITEDGVAVLEASSARPRYLSAR